MSFEQSAAFSVLLETGLYLLYFKSLLAHFHSMAISISFLQSEDQIHPFLNDLYSVSKELELSFTQGHHHQRNLHQIHHLNSSALRYFAFRQMEETNFSFIREDLAAVLMKFILLAVSDQASFKVNFPQKT